MPGGGGGDGNTTSTTVQQLSPEQKKILGLATPIFEQYLKGGTEGLKGLVYPGYTVAPQSPTEQLASSMLKTQATGALTDTSNAMLGGLNFLSSGQVLRPESNPGLQGAIDAATRPITKSFGEVIMPQVRGDAILSGGYGSNRQEINTRMAASDAERQIGDTAAALAFQGYNSGLDAMGRSLAFAPSVMQAAQTPGMTLSAIGAQERGFEQQMISDEMTRFYNQNFFPLMLAQQIAGTAFGYPGGSTLATTSGAGGGGPGALGGAIGGAALGTSIMPGWGTAAGAGIGALLGLFG